ncbi:hypothetical protein DQ04_08411050, partial [Trypanosoma grayi]|uniref:hypothetical protein n=1 Tax=Trypanosoma grayi TaxID=71804 RepID=UPI0004F4AF22
AVRLLRVKGGAQLLQPLPQRLNLGAAEARALLSLRPPLLVALALRRQPLLVHRRHRKLTPALTEQLRSNPCCCCCCCCCYCWPVCLRLLLLWLKVHEERGSHTEKGGGSGAGSHRAQGRKGALAALPLCGPQQRSHGTPMQCTVTHTHTHTEYCNNKKKQKKQRTFKRTWLSLPPTEQHNLPHPRTQPRDAKRSGVCLHNNAEGTPQQ